MKMNQFEKTQEIRHNGSLILFTYIVCIYLLMYSGAKTESNGIHSIKRFALVCTRCQRMENLVQCDLICKYVNECRYENQYK